MNYVIILDTKIGKEIKYQMDYDPSYWIEGNGACDCNRQLFFNEKFYGNRLHNDGKNEADNDELDTCLGSKRYLIMVHDYEGYNIDEFNKFYPDELILRLD